MDNSAVLVDDHVHAWCDFRHLILADEATGDGDPRLVLGSAEEQTLLEVAENGVAREAEEVTSPCLSASAS